MPFCPDCRPRVEMEKHEYLLNTQEPYFKCPVCHIEIDVDEMEE